MENNVPAQKKTVYQKIVAGIIIAVFVAGLIKSRQK